MHEVFRGGGEVGEDLSAVDWESTPLGPPDTWPQSLRTVVSIVLTSKFSMWMAWGPELTFFCNEAYRRDTLGRKYPWALGRPASEVWTEIWSDIGPRIDAVMQTGEATWDEALQLFLERSGYAEETYHTFSYSPLADDGGVIAGMLCVVSEETERIISARRMETLRLLGSQAPEASSESAALAEACRHLAANPASLPFTLTYLFDSRGSTAHLAGCTGIGEGHPAAPKTLDASAEAPVWPVAELAEGHSVLVEDLADRFPDLPTGIWQEPPARALLVPLQQRQRTPIGFLVVALNRYRQLDAAYQGFVDLIAGQLAAIIGSARAYESERQRAEELEELDRAKTAFFTNVSHEFRTPLTLLLGPAEDALADPEHPLPGDQRHRVEVIQRNGQRLLKLVNTLLDFSRLESGRTGAHFEPIDLAGYTRDLASMFESAAQRAGLRLTVDTQPLPELVYIDREMWAKIVLNLLSNALKFTFEGGIEVALTPSDEGPVLTVADTGIGIEAAELTHLFERFHRVAGARSRTHEGSGIGLALLAELVELHGGSVDVDSAPGEGSKFTVRMPWGAEHLPPEHVASKPVEAPRLPTQYAEGFLAETARWIDEGHQPGAEPAVGDTGAVRPRVLVVDDNADMREYVADLLSHTYTVETAVDGMDAMRKARATPPDLVLTDVMMPNLDGFGLMAALQKDVLTTGTPVIMISARAGEEGTVEGLAAGADDYLVKPFSARELLARVRSNLELDRARRTRTALERSQALLDHAQRLAHVGSWEIDLATGLIDATPEYLRLIGRTRDDLEEAPYQDLITQVVHPDDQARVREVLAEGVKGGRISYELRLLLPEGSERLVLVNGEVVRNESGEPVRIQGSMQDITEQRQAEQELAAAAAQREAAAREHQIADELQRSLLPERDFDPDHLDVATYYRAGVEGTQVGGDWYDVIELGAGRTALVVGDVMGRGVRAAAVMGQLRSAVRAYARLDLPPADVLECLDGMVRELGEDQIVTCVYAVFDPNDRSLTYANAGHLPPLLSGAGTAVQLGEAASPPLGAVPGTPAEARVEMVAGATVTLYTDGLVERRGRDIDLGVDALVEELSRVEGDVSGVPERLVEALLPEGPHDDVAVLVASVAAWAPDRSAIRRLTVDDEVVAAARAFVGDTLARWHTSPDVASDLVLMTSELVTNAVRHGRPPVDLRVRRNGDELILEVEDGDVFRPHVLRPTPDDEYGRGIQIVAMLADRWGSRATHRGKCVWCIVTDAQAGGVRSQARREGRIASRTASS
ncbi:MAG: SpoIIE family protein phosphatase [Nocardioidaceae bacterium]